MKCHIFEELQDQTTLNVASWIYSTAAGSPTPKIDCDTKDQPQEIGFLTNVLMPQAVQDEREDSKLFRWMIMACLEWILVIWRNL